MGFESSFFELVSCNHLLTETQKHVQSNILNIYLEQKLHASNVKMKCWVHSKQNAVALCKVCGKGVCQDCLVVLGGDNYCKACIESGRVAVVAPSPEPSVAESVPMSKGTPSKAFFVVGGVGCIVNTIAAIWFFFATLAPVFDYGLSSWIIGYVLLMIGLGLASVGYLGTHRNYGSGVGTASFAVAIVVSVLFLLWTVWLIVGYPIGYPYYEEYWQLRTYIWATIYEIFFAMMVLWGVTHITTRGFTGKSWLSFATGIMLIITAVFLEISTTLSVVSMMFWRYYDWFGFVEISELIWTVLFFASEILATILFFMVKVPESSVNPSY